MIPDLTEQQLESLHEILRDEIGEFGYTCDVTPRDWRDRELVAVANVRRKVLEFESNKKETT